MTRLYPEKKTCENCNNTFLAKRSDANCCSNSCRARLSEMKKTNEVVFESGKPFNRVDDTPDLAKGTNSKLIEEIEQFEELELCDNCYYYFEKKDFYHHKSRAWFSDLYFCQKCLSCCNLSKEDIAINFEQHKIYRWNADNKHNPEVLQILWK